MASNTSSRRKIRIFFGVTVAVSLIASVCRTLAVILEYDRGIGFYFVNGARLPWVTACVLALFAVAGIGYVRDLGDEPIFDGEGTGFEFFGSMYLSFASIAELIYTLTVAFGGQDGEVMTPEQLAAAVTERNLTIMLVVALALSAVYFLLCAFEKRRRGIAVICGFFPCLRALAGVGAVYFNMKIPMNSPSKIWLQLSLVMVMIFFLYELRMSLGGERRRPRTWLWIASVTFCLIISVSVSEMLGYLRGSIEFTDFLTENFYCLNVAFYILLRLLGGAFGPLPEEHAPEASVGGGDSPTVDLEGAEDNEVPSAANEEESEDAICQTSDVASVSDGSTKE